MECREARSLNEVVDQQFREGRALGRRLIADIDDLAGVGLGAWVVLDLAEVVARRNVETIADLETAGTPGDPVTEDEPADEDGPDDRDADREAS